MFQTNVVEKTKKKQILYTTFFLNHAGYEMMWKNIEPNKSQMKI
jgi:hypothetical protein